MVWFSYFLPTGSTSPAYSHKIITLPSGVYTTGYSTPPGHNPILYIFYAVAFLCLWRNKKEWLRSHKKTRTQLPIIALIHFWGKRWITDRSKSASNYEIIDTTWSVLIHSFLDKLLCIRLLQFFESNSWLLQNKRWRLCQMENRQRNAKRYDQ